MDKDSAMWDRRSAAGLMALGHRQEGPETARKNPIGRMMEVRNWLSADGVFGRTLIDGMRGSPAVPALIIRVAGTNGKTR
jgi:hypothetical protein